MDNATRMAWRWGFIAGLGTAGILIALVLIVAGWSS